MKHRFPFSLLQQLYIKKTHTYFAKTTLSVSVSKLCNNDFCAILHFNNSNKLWNIMISIAKQILCCNSSLRKHHPFQWNGLFAERSILEPLFPFTMSNPGCCWSPPICAEGRIYVCEDHHHVRSFLLLSVVLQQLCKQEEPSIPVRHFAHLLYSSITKIQFGTRT